MKKSWIAFIAIFMVMIAFAGCSSEKATHDVAGGYREAEDKNLTPELIEIFDKALKDNTDMDYSPVLLEATQVVAGINYKFKADGIKTTEPMKQGIYYVYIYKDLQGSVSLLNIEVIEEHELKKFEPSVELDTELKLK